ncbi:glycosyltransferase family 39 protein [Marinilabilia sp.]|uniref:ArnT family glycosyltransferase n=1 Tax=Marinilabilia sp. TaxID=2021252 RepID=UPI0025C4D2F7|nr:glycosyltransferase family 39 protein [Marinilabilia sp.]
MTNTLTRILKNNTFFYSLLIITGAWHVWSLIYSPLPWFDETFFVSITKSLLKGNGFLLEVCPIQTEGKEVLTYGPIYFLLTGLSFLIFGTGIFQFRIVSLLFAVLSIVVFSRISLKLNLGRRITRFLVLLLIFDVITVQNSHSGRMDMVALFFGMIAWWSYVQPRKNIRYIIIMAVSGVAAVLTTPRIVVVVFPLFIYALFRFIQSKNFLRASLITLLPAFVYLMWIVLAFGSTRGFIEHFTGPAIKDTDAANSIFNYMGGNLYIPFHQWPLITTALLSAALMIFKKQKLSLLFLIALPIVTFYVVVTDTGAYSALIMPFWYLVVGFGLQITLDKENNKVSRISIYGLVLITVLCNTGIFALKAATIVGSQQERDPRPLQEWVNKNIPENSKIVGDDRYYYACILNHCDYQYIDRVKDHATRARFHVTKYQPDFLFISNQTTQSVIDAYKKEFHFLDTKSYTPENNNSLISKTIKLLPVTIQSSYEGTLIRVKTKNSTHQPNLNRQAPNNMDAYFQKSADEN